ncbi:RidA family protein [Candidatus Gottesmanbacteria bacterium]|nr:RidA family protein [Candidatus Gottesmanbacteria bacterium]
MKYIDTNKAPKVVGPYSQAIVSGDFVFLSGQIGVNPKTNNLVEGIENQAKQIFSNITEILEAAGTDKTKVLKTTVFIKNISDFAKVNELYESFFEGHKPARSTVEVSSLPKGALIEIDTIASLK